MEDKWTKTGDLEKPYDIRCEKPKVQQPTSLQNDASLSSSPPQFAKSVKGFSMLSLAILSGTLLA